MAEKKPARPVKLAYVGITYDEGCVPLPEGWPARDHTEPDAEVAAEKLAFRMKVTGDDKGKHTGGLVYRVDTAGEE